MVIRRRRSCLELAGRTAIPAETLYRMLDRLLPRVIDEVIKMQQHKDGGIESFCLWFDKPFTWPRLNAVLQTLAQLRGPDLLRMKGIVHVEGEPGPIVIQGAVPVLAGDTEAIVGAPGTAAAR